MNTTQIKPNAFAIACMAWNGYYHGKSVPLALPVAVPAPAACKVFETHHLQKPNKLNKFCRNICRWLARHAPLMGEIKGHLSDMEDEERMMNEVRSETRSFVKDAVTLEQEQTSYIDSLPLCPTTSIQFGSFSPVSTESKPKVVNTVNARIINEVRIALIAKLGFLPDTTTNRLIVDKEARKIMKDNNFRAVVIASHIAHIDNAFFECRVEEEKAGGARRKCSNWLLRFLGFATKNTTSQ